MAELHLQTVKVSYAGSKETIRELKTALKEKTSPAVKAALAYAEKLGAKTDGRSFDVDIGDDWDNLPDPFVDLSREFPRAAFIFDFWYSGQAAGCDGDGRYYCVYEGGKKVYDADSWLEQYAHLNEWINGLKVEGDFYDTDEEGMKALIARGRLVEQGKKQGKDPEDILAEITDADVEACIAGFDADLISGIEMCVPCNFAEFRAYGFQTYERMYKDLSDGDYGYDHYLELKGEGDLPSFNAEANRFTYDYEAEAEAGVRKPGPRFDPDDWGDSDFVIEYDEDKDLYVLTEYMGEGGDVVIPDDKEITKIGRDAFHGCKGLTSVHIPDGVTTIRARAFMGCSSLTSARIPDSVTEIMTQAFDSTGLTAVKLPASLKRIGTCAFGECAALASVTFPDSLQLIKDNAFIRCAMTAVFIPDSVQEIQDVAFAECAALTEISVPAGADIAADAFEGCPGTPVVRGKPKAAKRARKPAAKKPSTTAKTAKPAPQPQQNASTKTPRQTTRRFLCRNAQREMFWEITTDRIGYTVRYGKTGSAGTREGYAFDSPTDCRAAAEKAIADKVKKGYAEEKKQKSKTPKPTRKPKTEKD